MCTASGDAAVRGARAEREPCSEPADVDRDQRRHRQSGLVGHAADGRVARGVDREADLAQGLTNRPRFAARDQW